MKIHHLAMRMVLVLVVVVVGPLWGETSFWLRNTDPGAVFYYWTVDAGRPAEVLAALPLAPGGRHGVAPGERVRVVLGSLSLVGVFVPWDAPVDYRSKLTGGFLLSSEIPVKGTVLVDRPSFAAANRGRSLDSPLQAWNLTPPILTLMSPKSWSGLRPLVEWGPGFLPGGQPWPLGWPRLRTLQSADREGALWVRLVYESGGYPSGVTVSLALRRPGAFLEWPLTSKDSTVWSWVEGSEPVSVGHLVFSAKEMEAWVPWDRLSEADRKAWSSPLVWSLIVTENEAPRTLDLVPTSLGEWP